MKFTMGNLRPHHGGEVVSSQVVISAGGLTLPLTPTPGNMLVAFGFGYASAPTVDAAWTEITDARHNAAVLDPNIRACWQLVGGSPSPAVTPFSAISGGRQGTAVFEIAGLSPFWTPTYERSDIQTNNFGGNISTVTRTTASANTLLLAAGFTETNSADPGVGSISGTPSAWTAIGSAHGTGGEACAAAYQLIAAASTAVTATYSAPGGNSCICLISLLPVI